MAKKRVNKITEAPTCSCLLLCDDVIVSHSQGKHTLHGIIGGLYVPELPATVGNQVAYLRLSNVYPPQKVTVSLEHAETGDQIWEFQAEFVPPVTPLQVLTLVTRVPPYRLAASGRYILRANHDGVPLAQVPIEVHTMVKDKEQEQADDNG